MKEPDKFTGLTLLQLGGRCVGLAAPEQSASEHELPPNQTVQGKIVPANAVNVLVLISLQWHGELGLGAQHTAPICMLDAP